MNEQQSIIIEHADFATLKSVLLVVQVIEFYEKNFKCKTWSYTYIYTYMTAIKYIRKKSKETTKKIHRKRKFPLPKGGREPSMSTCSQLCFGQQHDMYLIRTRMNFEHNLREKNFSFEVWEIWNQISNFLPTIMYWWSGCINKFQKRTPSHRLITDCKKKRSTRKTYRRWKASWPWGQMVSWNTLIFCSFSQI